VLAKKLFGGVVKKIMWGMGNKIFSAVSEMGIWELFHNGVMGTGLH